MSSYQYGTTSSNGILYTNTTANTDTDIIVTSGEFIVFNLDDEYISFSKEDLLSLREILDKWNYNKTLEGKSDKLGL